VSLNVCPVARVELRDPRVPRWAVGERRPHAAARGAGGDVGAAGKVAVPGLVRVRKRILALTATGHKIAGTALSGRIGPG
jgi:hypothetical protein